ncbi:melatonin receptor type 1B-A-like [Saccostrea echinata]|uniref:melatonin receptor type 1B-A-like n=1 Tax=Saccostrea echinata TaxID=191078 RepID=UPI002A82ED16|nr:melatonin receptor type 1B-A-like [Saccostrea echinata]
MNESIALTPGPRVFDRYEFVSESPAVGVFLLIVLIFASLVGAFGNLLILVSLCKCKMMKSLECIFIGNLAISDLYVTLVADPMSIIAKLEGEPFFNSIDGLCQGIAYICTMACVNSLGSITLMSFNRYIFICHHKYYYTIFKKRTCIAMCFCLYIVGLTLVLLNLAGIGDHSFDRKSLECIWDRMATYYYTVVFSILLVWIPVIITGIFYLKIFVTVRKSTKKITEVTCADHNRKSVNLARTLFFIYVIFSLCWIPYALIIVIDRNDTFSYEPHLILTVFGHLHPSINWLVYYFTNTKFRKAFDKLVKLNKLFDLCKRKKKEIPIEMSKTPTQSNEILTKIQNFHSSSGTE